mgnify:CR=1 FL=1
MEIKPKNDYEALVLALTLSVTAVNEEKSQKALTMAEEFAAKLSELEVERAKREAEKAVEKMLEET